MADYQDILKRAIQIRDAVLEGTNTASLVGGVMVDTLYLSRKLETTINQVIKSIKELGGSGGTGGGSIDENTLAAYLINNGYAKLTDIPSSWWGQTANANNVVQGSMSQVLSLLFTNETIALDGIANEDTPTDSKAKIVTPNYVYDKFIPRKEDANVLGSLTFDKIQKFLKGLKIGEIYLSYDSANNALRLSKDAAGKEAANFYALGGITAYGAGASTTGGGGGLNGSVKRYSDALKLTSESLSEVASAYSIKALDSRISSLEGGSATAISVSGSGNAVTSVTKNGTTISVVKGATFLTSHQSLASYLTKTDAASLYQPKGNYLTAHQSLDGYLKLSGGAMTGNIRYKGSKSTYDMIKFVDNNADTYGNGICIGGGGLTIIGGGESADIVLSQHTNGSDENMIVANDYAIDFFSNVQNGWNSRKAGSFDTSGYWNGAGFKKDNSSDSYVLLGGGGHKAISSLSVNYASSAGNADTVDGYHAISGNDKPFGTIPVITTSGWMEVGRQLGFHFDNTTGSDYSTALSCSGNYSNKVFLPSAAGTLALTSDNVASATKLQTPRTIWGQSFDGTGNVNGTIYINNQNSSNGAIRLNNDISANARISAISDQVIFNTGAAIRFGETDWDWNQWAGLKYNHSKKTIYLGIADDSVFNANSAQTGGTLSLQNIHNIKMMYNAIDNIYCNFAKFISDNKITIFDSDWNAIIESGELDINCSTYITDGSLTIVRAETNGYKYGLSLDDTSIICNFGYNAPNNKINMMYQGSNININSYGNILLNTYRGAIYLNTSTSVKGNLLATGGVTAYSSSDIRLKQDLRKLDYLGIIKAMGGTFGFAWKKDNTRSIGWIAQHVLCNPHLKDIVETDENGYYKINYWSPKLIATAFGAIEQVDDEVTRLKKKVNTLENRVKELEIK